MTIQRYSTKIDGYEVSLELYEEGGEPRSDCFVTYETRQREYSSSLAALSATGELEDRNFEYAHEVHPQTIAAIEKWAEDNGY